MELKPGSRWRSAVGEGEVVVVRPPKTPASLECGGHPMIPLSAKPEPGVTMAPGHGAGILAGKRYGDDETGLEVLCSKGGSASLSVDGRPIEAKEAKKLPSSD